MKKCFYVVIFLMLFFIANGDVFAYDEYIVTNDVHLGREGQAILGEGANTEVGVCDGKQETTWTSGETLRNETRFNWLLSNTNLGLSQSDRFLLVVGDMTQYGCNIQHQNYQRLLKENNVNKAISSIGNHELYRYRYFLKSCIYTTNITSTEQAAINNDNLSEEEGAEILTGRLYDSQRKNYINVANNYGVYTDNNGTKHYYTNSNNDINSGQWVGTAGSKVKVITVGTDYADPPGTEIGLKWWKSYIFNNGLPQYVTDAQGNYVYLTDSNGEYITVNGYKQKQLIEDPTGNYYQPYLYAYNKPEYYEYIEEQLKDAYDNGKIAIIMTHQPANKTVFKDNIDHFYTGLQAADNRLNEIINKYPNAIIVSGHFHKYFSTVTAQNGKIGGIYENDENGSHSIYFHGGTGIKGTCTSKCHTEGKGGCGKHDNLGMDFLRITIENNRTAQIEQLNLRNTSTATPTTYQTIYWSWWKTTYKANDGTANLLGESWGYEPIKTYNRTGYKLNSWNTKADGSGTTVPFHKETDPICENGSTHVSCTSHTADQTLYAQWDINKLKVKYNLNGGELDEHGTNFGVNGNDVVTYNNEEFEHTIGSYGQTLSAQYGLYNYDNPAYISVKSKKGYEVPEGEEWATKDNQGNIVETYDQVKTDYQVSDFADLSNDSKTVELFLNWQPTNYTISYDLDGGAIENAPETYNIETATFTLPTPTKPGYRFLGWTGATGSATPQTTVTINPSQLTEEQLIDRTYVANWERINYPITYELDGGTATNPSSYNVETTTFTLNNPTKTGYTFTGWTGSNGSTPQKSITIETGSTGSKEYTAEWEPVDYTIIYELDGGRLNSLALTNYNIESETYTLLTPTKTGYTFTGWTGSNGSTPQKTVTIPQGSTGNKGYVANWEPVEYTITYHLNGGTATNPNSYTIETETFVLNNPVKTGYTFTGWTENDGETPQKLMIISKGTTGDKEYTANYEVNDYTISFDSNGGSSVDSITAPYGTTVTKPSNPTKIGNTFVGWYSDSNLTQAYTFSTMPAENITLYAKWSVNNYTISFNSNGGSSVASITQAYGSSVTKPNNPTKAGYTFAEWYSDSNLTNPYSFNTMPAENITLYAKWNVNYYTISFNSNGGSSVASITKAYGSEVTKPTDPTKEGYTFGGWYSDSNLTNAYTFSTMPSEDKTLYAKWNVNNYTISFNSNGGSSVSSITKAYGTAVTAPTDPVWEGHTFAGWYSDSGLTSLYSFTTMPAENITLYAKWTINGQTISYVLNGGENATDNPTTYTPGQEIALKAATKTGNTFDGWYTDSEFTNRVESITSDMTGAITLYAKWTINNYTITFNSNGGSDVSSITKAYGASVTAPANPTKAGYEFKGWYSDSNLTNAYTFSTMPAENKTLYAKWSAYKLSIKYNMNEGLLTSPHGNEIGTSGNYITVDNETVIESGTYGGQLASGDLLDYNNENYINITKRGYSAILGAEWNTKADGTGISYNQATQYSVASLADLSDGNKTVELFVNWEVIEYAINYELDGGTLNYTAPTKYNVESSTITLINPTKEGYRFIGWTGSNGSEPEMTVTIPSGSVGTKTYTANWELVDYEIEYNLNGGHVSYNPETYNKNTTTFTLNNPTKTGYTFIGWTGSNGVVPETTVTITKGTTGNKSYIANYEANTYTISFNSNGGSSVASITKAYGAEVTEPSAPTKTGYTFKGWYSDSGLTNAYTFSTMPREDITLYAKWTINNYTISFNSNGGSSVASITKAYGSEVTKPTDPTKKGYTFAGWYSDSDLTSLYSFTTMPAHNQTLYAKWNTNNYTIIFNSNGGSGVESITAPYGSTITKPEDPTKTGNTFGGWYSDSELTEAYTFSTMPNEDTTLYAKWNVNSYTISFNSNGGSSVTSITKGYGASVEAPENPTWAGHTFAGWYSDSELTSLYSFTTMPAHDVTLYAKWSTDSQVINYVLNGGTNATDNPTTYTPGESKILKPATKVGNTFGGWYSDSEFNIRVESITSDMTGNITLYAKWTVNSYTISFNSNGGSSVSSITKGYGETVTKPADPTKTGNRFIGWYSDSNLTELYNFTTMPAENITLYAKWVVEERTISYVLNGGVNATDNPTTYIPGEEKTLKPATRTGYTFKGWYSDSNFTTRVESITADMTENITLYAKWEANDYTISFNSNGGSSVSPITRAYGTAVTEPTNPTKEGYLFGGWYSDSNLTDKYTFTTMPAENKTLYAKWINNTVVVHFETNGGSNLEEITIEKGTPIEVMPTTTKTGYTFKGWYKDASFTDEFDQDEEINSNLTLYAKWQINTYTISYESNGGTSVNSENVNYNQKANRPSNPTKEGYTFAGWYKDVILVTEYDFNTPVDHDITLYAKWSPRSYILVYETNGGTPIEATEIEYGQPVPEPSNPTKEGYTFAGWYTDSNLSHLYTFGTMPADNMTLYAKWATQNEYVISYETEGGAMPSSAPTTYHEGDVIRLQSPTREGYTFKGWYTDPSFTNRIEEITAGSNENITLYAKWEQDGYVVTFDLDGEEFDTETITPGSEANLPVPSKTGYSFSGWYTDEEMTTLYDYTQGITSGTHLYGKFIKNSYTISFNSNGGTSVNDITELYESELQEPNTPYKEGYRFAGWYTDKELTKPYIFESMPAHNVTLYAKWIANGKYVIKYITNGGVNNKDNPTSYKEGEVKTIKPATKKGSTFLGWYTESGEKITSTKGLAEDLTLYADWDDDEDDTIVKIPDTASNRTLVTVFIGIGLVLISGYLVSTKYGYNPFNSKKE